MRLAIKNDELHIGVFVLSFKNCRLKLESGANDEVVTCINKVTDFLQVVSLSRSCGLEILDIQCVVLACSQDAFPGSLIEGFIVDGTGIGNHTDTKIALLRCPFS